MASILKTSEISIDNEMQRSYLDYAMSVIIGRALPDIRDGLKPVHRRVLFAMHKLQNYHNKPYKKSAKIVGEVIGQYHPHGDGAVYDTIVRMAQSFSLRYPLVDGQGNFGSIDGDSPAAMRYTEIRMKSLAEEMLADLDKNTVLWNSNYDDSGLEPSVLPTKFPSLLVNGSSGIAVGMATNIPPHNLGEVIEGIKYLIETPKANFYEIMKYIPGPDFPTAGIIYGTSGIINLYSKGRGLLKLRGTIVVEKNELTWNETVVITEIPYQVNKSKLVESIDSLIKKKQINGIRYIRDESDRVGMRIALGVKKDRVADVIINQLYKHSQMEITFGAIFLAIVDKKPIMVNLKEILKYFIDYRKKIIIKRTLFNLNKLKDKAHILKGKKIAVRNLKEIVSTIRSALSPSKAEINLINKFKFSFKQVKSILSMKLHQLTSIERDKILFEYNSILEKIKKLSGVLKNNNLILDIIDEELNEIKEKFVDKRKTKIVLKTKDLTNDDIITKENMVVTISNQGYIKRNSVKLYQSQGRGGRGKIAMNIRDDDFVSNLFVASTHHFFFFFTNMGKVYYCKVYDIPLVGRQSRGKAIVNFFNFTNNEKMTAVLAVQEFDENKYVFMATKNGIVKKTNLMEFSRTRAIGIFAIKLTNGDELIDVKLSNGRQDVFLGTSSGKSIRFHESNVRLMGRNAIGVRGIKLVGNNVVVGMEILSRGQMLFVVTENGFGKKTSVDEYPIQKRGGKGIITIKTNERNGKVVSIILVNNHYDLMIVTDLGKLIRIPVTSSSTIGRNTQGVKLIVMEENERVVSTVGLSENKDGIR